MICSSEELVKLQQNLRDNLSNFLTMTKVIFFPGKFILFKFSTGETQKLKS